MVGCPRMSALGPRADDRQHGVGERDARHQETVSPWELSQRRGSQSGARIDAVNGHALTQQPAALLGPPEKIDRYEKGADAEHSKDVDHSWLELGTHAKTANQKTRRHHTKGAVDEHDPGQGFPGELPSARVPPSAHTTSTRCRAMRSSTNQYPL